MSEIENWLDVDVSHQCDNCRHSTGIHALGSSGLKLRCDEYDCTCYPSCTILTTLFSEEPVAYKLPSGDIARYQCPECKSKNIKRTPYDYGFGYVDVRVECQNCEEYIWE